MVSHLQFANFRIILGETSIENLWTIKSIIKSFKLTLSLMVNFSKTSLFGINVDVYFLYLSENFLNYKIQFKA